MDGFKVDSIMVSGNSKTGLSINVDQCSPTKWCYQHCYRRWRTVEMIARMGWNTTPNTGPVTWKVQRAAYKRNERAIVAAALDGRLDEITSRMVERIRARGYDTLRGNGTGDLFPELCEMYARLASHGIKLFLFSRRPDMVRELLRLCDALGVAVDNRPFVMGSVDPDTTPEAWAELISVTEAMNGEPALAYSTDTRGEAGCAEVDGHPAREHFVVVFGYHSNQTKTVLGHKLECPATAGGKIKCDACRRCYGR